MLIQAKKLILLCILPETLQCYQLPAENWVPVFFSELYYPVANQCLHWLRFSPTTKVDMLMLVFYLMPHYARRKHRPGLFYSCVIVTTVDQSHYFYALSVKVRMTQFWVKMNTLMHKV